MAKKHIDYPQSFNENYTDEDIKDVKAIIDWLNGSQSRTNRYLSKNVGNSDAYISTLLTGKHQGQPCVVITKIQSVMRDSQLERQQGEFVHTSVSNVIFHACQSAKEADEGGFVIISGSPGVGKTTALEQYKEEHPNSIYIVGSESTNGSAVLDEILQNLNIKCSQHVKKKAKEGLIIDALKGTNRLIILDETDKCHIDTPDPLRTISDKAGIGVVLAGNVGLRDDVATGQGRYDLIEDRVVFWPQLIKNVSAQDVHLLLKPYFTDDILSPEETFEEIADYAGKLVGGSARKLIKGLVKNAIKVHNAYSKDASRKYKGISRQLLASVAKSFLGINHPEQIPRKATVVNV